MDSTARSPGYILALFSIVKWPCFRLSKFRRGDQNGPVFDCQVALFSLDKNMRELKYQTTLNIVPRGLYSFEFARTRYVIPAWYSDEDKLIRILRLGKGKEKLVGLEISAGDEIHTSQITVDVYGDEVIEDLEPIENLTIKILNLEEPIGEEIARIAAEDEIVAAALFVWRVEKTR